MPGLGPGGAYACLAEGGGEPGVALAGGAGFALVGRLPGLGCVPGPRDQVPGGGEAGSPVPAATGSWQRTCALPAAAARACSRAAPARTPPATPCRYPARHPRYQLSRLLSDVLHPTCPPASSSQIPAAARRSQQGQQGGIACSRQQCRTLEAAPGDQTNSRAHSTKLVRRRRATTPDFSPSQDVPARGYLGLTRLHWSRDGAAILALEITCRAVSPPSRRVFSAPWRKSAGCAAAVLGADRRASAAV